jgi:hypothetical protein
METAQRCDAKLGVGIQRRTEDNDLRELLCDEAIKFCRGAHSSKDVNAGIGLESTGEKLAVNASVFADKDRNGLGGRHCTGEHLDSFETEPKQVRVTWDLLRLRHRE